MGCPQKNGVPHSWKCSRPGGWGLGQTGLEPDLWIVNPAHVWGLELDDLWDPFHPKPFYDYKIVWFYHEDLLQTRLWISAEIHRVMRQQGHLHDSFCCMEDGDISWRPSGFQVFEWPCCIRHCEREEQQKKLHIWITAFFTHPFLDWI